jgi:hypothetical protein
MFRPISVRLSARAGVIDSFSLIPIYFNIRTLTAGILRAETALQFSDNKTLLSICGIQTNVVGKEG